MSVFYFLLFGICIFSDFPERNVCHPYNTTNKKNPIKVVLKKIKLQNTRCLGTCLGAQPFSTKWWPKYKLLQRSTLLMASLTP